MNRKVSFVFALLLVALPFLIASRTAPAPVRAGELELFFPAGTATSGGYQEFSTPFNSRPVVVVSASSQNYGQRVENLAGIPDLDYFATTDGISVIGVLASPAAVDTVYTVSWIAIPNLP